MKGVPSSFLTARVYIRSRIEKRQRSKTGLRIFQNVDIMRSVHGSYARFMDRGPYSDAMDTRPMERPE